MTGESVNRDLRLGETPPPPLFKLVGDGGEDAFQEAEVGGERASVGALFSDRRLAEGFAAEADEFGMGAMAGGEARELPDWRAVEAYALSGQDYVLVVSGRGTGLFYARDLVRHAVEGTKEIPLPLYLFSDERGESPLISVETDEGEVSVAALFSSPEKAQAFRGKAAHLDLPEGLGAIEDRDGLGRHARVARQAGAEYAVVDPESGLTEAIPLEELIG